MKGSNNTFRSRNFKNINKKIKFDLNDLKKDLQRDTIMIVSRYRYRFCVNVAQRYAT